MKRYTFKIAVKPDEDRWRAYCPALKQYGATTWGYTREEALYLRFQHQDGRRVTVTFHKSSDTFAPQTLKSMFDQARWTEEDLKRLKLIK